MQTCNLETTAIISTEIWSRCINSNVEKILKYYEPSAMNSGFYMAIEGLGWFYDVASFWSAVSIAAVLFACLLLLSYRRVIRRKLDFGWTVDLLGLRDSIIRLRRPCHRITDYFFLNLCFCFYLHARLFERYSYRSSRRLRPGSLWGFASRVRSRRWLLR